MKPKSLADVVLLPLTLLERSSGWKRKGFLVLYAAVLLVLGSFAYRMTCLSRLPNAPEPFDLEKYARIDVPDGDNAIVAYRELIAKFGQLSTKDYKIPDNKAVSVTDWSLAHHEIQRWVGDNRAVLEPWVAANDRGNSLLVQPGELRMGTLLEPLESVRSYVWLTLLEGSRLEHAGDVAGAWRMYRTALRASRHAGRHGGIIPRLIGWSALQRTRPRVAAWVNAPGVTPELLRRALADVETCWAMTSPASEMVRAEYYSARDSVYDTSLWIKLTDKGPYSSANWINQIGATSWLRQFLRRDPERSARVLRLITAGYLAQCDRPPSVRAKLAFPNSLIYARDSATPDVLRSMSPEDLEAWTNDSAIHDLNPYSSMIMGHIDAEPVIFETFKLAIAERAFELEHGRPAKTYGELLNGYLKTLPDRIEAQDPINAPTSPKTQP